jgi:alpha-L-fucosidase
MGRVVTGAYLLADAKKSPLKVTAAGAGYDVALPGKALDPVATVLVLTTK